MATLTGTALLEAMLAEQGVEISELQQQAIAARFQQMIDAGTTSNLQFAAVLAANTQFRESVPEGENPATFLATVIGEQITIIEEGEGPTEITFDLAVSDDSVFEGEASTFTVTASQAVEQDTEVTLQVTVGDGAAADQGTTTTNFNDFGAGSLNLITKTIAAGETSVAFDVAALADTITELSETFTVEVTVGADTFTRTITVLDGAGENVGQTFTLTTGVDNVPGTTANDTITGVFGGASGDTYTTADSIDGAAGTDILSLTAQGTTASPAAVDVKNIEYINIRDVVGATFNAQLISDNPIISFFDTLSTQTSTVNNASTSQLFGISGAGNLTVDFADTSGTSDTAMLSLSGAGTSSASSTIDVSNSNTIEAVTIATTGSNYFSLDAGSEAGSITMTGDGVNELTVTDADSTLTLDASGTTGTNTFELGTVLSTTDTIIGGAGTDSVTANLTAATLITPEISGVEEVELDFDAAATFNMTDTTGVTMLTLDDSSENMTVTNATVSTVNVTSQDSDTDTNNVLSIGYAEATDVTLNLGGSSDQTLASAAINNNDGALAINTTGSKDNTITGNFEADSATSFALNVNDGGDISLGGTTSTDALDSVSIDVGASANAYINWLEADGAIGDVDMSVAAGGSGEAYIDASAADVGSVGNVSLDVTGDDASGYLFVSAYGSGDNHQADMGDVTMNVAGDEASGYLEVDASSGNINSVTVTAEGDSVSAIISAYASADYDGSFYTNGGHIGDVDLSIDGTGSAYMSAYIVGSGSVGNVTLSATGDETDASAYVYSYAYSGDASGAQLDGTGSIGNISVTQDAASGYGYYYFEADSGNVGTVDLDFAGVSGDVDFYVSAYDWGGSGVSAGASGDIGDVTVNVGDDMYSAYVAIDASGSVGNVVVNAGNNAYVEVDAEAYSGDMGSYTATVGDGTDFSGSASTDDGTIGDMSLIIGSDSSANFSAYNYSGDTGDMTVTAGDDTYLNLYQDSNLAGVGATTVTGTASDIYVYIDAATTAGNIDIEGADYIYVNLEASQATDTLDVGTVTLTGGTEAAASAEIIANNANDVQSIAGIDTTGYAGDVTIDLSTTNTGTTVELGDGDNTVDGTEAADNIFGGSGIDTIDGGLGNDLIEGGAGDDVITDTDGDNIMNGDAGDDTITGGAGADTIDGGADNDTLIGAAGNDIIEGGTGDDEITGGAGADELTGGAGADTFIYTATTESNVAALDSISDLVLNDANGDIIDLSVVIAAVAENTEAALALSDANTEAELDGLFDSATGTATDATFDGANIMAILATFTDGTLLVIDADADGSYVDANDMVIDVTGVTNTSFTTDVFA